MAMERGGNAQQGRVVEKAEHRGVWSAVHRRTQAGSGARSLRKRSGSTALSYALLLGLVGVTAISATSALGIGVSELLNTFADRQDGNRPPAIAGQDLGDFFRGDSIALQVDAVDEDGDPLSLSSSDLPSGLSISGLRVAGTAGDPAVYQFTLTVSDGDDARSADYRYRVVNRAPVFDTASDLGGVPNGETMAPITLSATDPDAQPVFLTAGPLPSGLSFDGVALTGTPSGVGPQSFDVTATDSQGLATTRSFTITFQDEPPTITSDPDLGIVAVDTPITPISLTATDPEGLDVVFALDDGESLPNGLVLNDNQITGTPDTLGIYTFRLIASDPYGASDSADFSMTVTNCIETTVTHTTSGTFALSIPTGCTSAIVTLVAGGGGGGGANETGGGGGAGGGGSGGCIQNQAYALSGAGGTGSIIVGDRGNRGGNAGSGGNSSITMESHSIVVTGGAGGRFASGNPTAGAAGGSPGGSNGVAGVRLSGEHGTGGRGGHSCLGTGGAGGGSHTSNATGSNGTGYGSGGGGAGVDDRTSPHSWNGGYGAGGYAQIRFVP